jgi:hypothetical protein
MEAQFAKVDSKTAAQLRQWWASRDEREKRLHILALTSLKKVLNQEDDGDQGSYFPERSHSFRAWVKKQTSK